MVKITVITVCYNEKEKIKDTILSVVNQDYANFEYLIIDGNSDDGTVELSSKILQKINKSARVISEKDTGIYNAMNKGVNLANGDFIVFMNAGDSFYSASTLRVLAEKTEGYDIVYGNHCIVRGEKAKIIHAEEVANIVKHSVFCHQATMTKRDLLLHNPFDESLTIVADYDFFLKQYMAKKKFLYVDVTVAYYNPEGVSSDLSQTRKLHDMVRRKYGLITSRQEKEEFFVWKCKDIVRQIVPRKIKNILYRDKIVKWWD